MLTYQFLMKIFADPIVRVLADPVTARGDDVEEKNAHDGHANETKTR